MRTLDGVGILRRSAEVYAAARSYVDTGLVSIARASKDAQPELPPEVYRFETAFIRPERFFFEFRDEGRPHTIRRNGGHARVSSFLHGALRQELSAAIAAASEVSGGSAWRVPTLLMPQVFRKDATSPYDAGQVSLDGEELVEGHACWRLVVTTPGATVASRLWIDCTSFLLRKVQESDTTTTYHPRTEVDIDPRRFTNEGFFSVH